MDYFEKLKAIRDFLKESNISAYDLVKCGKDLCCCRTCKYFVQHYAKNGSPVDFGHCIKNNIPRTKKPNMQSCGFWSYEENAQERGTHEND